MTDETDSDAIADETTRRDFVKTGALATGALVVGGGATAAARSGGESNAAADLNGRGGGQFDFQDGGQDDEAAGRFASVEFPNQAASGAQVLVNEATLSDPGYVTFHGPSLVTGDVVGSVVGVTDYQDAGIHYQLTADLFDVPGAEFQTTQLQGPTPLVAMPHRETSGNETYDFVSSDGADDGPFTEAGLPVVDLAFVSPGEGDGGAGTATGTAGTETGTATDTPGTETATDTAAGTETGTETGTGTGTPGDAEGEAQPFASVDFANQPIEGGAVTVGEVVVSEGGFVSLHDARLLQGMAFESVVGTSDYLAPGRHRNVEVSIDEDAQITSVPVPGLPLAPMPHRDTNDNQQYDFVSSEGADDGPYLEAGQPVVDLGLVRREAAEGTATGTGTATEAGTETETETEPGTTTETGTATDTDVV